MHSYDLVNAFWHFFKNPKVGEIYNIGGGRKNAISVLEAINYVEEILNKQMIIKYEKKNRKGDHIWWISDFKKFQKDFALWSIKYDLKDIIEEICFLKSEHFLTN